MHDPQTLPMHARPRPSPLTSHPPFLSPAARAGVRGAAGTQQGRWQHQEEAEPVVQAGDRAVRHGVRRAAGGGALRARGWPPPQGQGGGQVRAAIPGPQEEEEEAAEAAAGTHLDIQGKAEDGEEWPLPHQECGLSPCKIVIWWRFSSPPYIPFTPTGLRGYGSLVLARRHRLP